jgi:hypothetical protein
MAYKESGRPDKPMGTMVDGPVSNSCRTRNHSEMTPATELPPATPRWVKVFAVIFAVFILVFVILHLTGYGPGLHHGMR